MPSTSTRGDWIIIISVCMLLPPGPEQSSLMMTLRRACAEQMPVARRKMSASGRDLGAGIFFVLLLPCRPGLLGRVDEGAGVHDHHVRVLGIRNDLHAGLVEVTDHDLAVHEVLGAAK